MKIIRIYDWMGHREVGGFTKGQEIPWDKRHEVIDHFIEVLDKDVMFKRLNKNEYVIYIDTQGFRRR